MRKTMKKRSLYHNVDTQPKDLSQINKICIILFHNKVVYNNVNYSTFYILCLLLSVKVTIKLKIETMNKRH